MRVHLSFLKSLVPAWVAMATLLGAASNSTVCRAEVLGCTLDAYAAMGGMVAGTGTRNYLLSGDPTSAPLGGMETWGYAWLKFEDGKLPASPIASAVLQLQSIAQTSGMWTAPEDSPVEVSVCAVTADVADIEGSISSSAFRASIVTPPVATTVVAGGNGVYEWDVTDVVNGWIASGDNVGLVLTIGEGAIPKFHSMESTTGLGPRIVVSDVPEPGAIAMFLSAGAIGVGLTFLERRRGQRIAV